LPATQRPLAVCGSQGQGHRARPDRGRAVTGPLGTQAAADLAGVTYRQVDHWCRVGYIRGGYLIRCDSGTHRRGHMTAGGGGSGTHTLLSPRELDVLLLMARLTRAGLNVARSAHLARLSVEENTRTLPLGAGLVLLVGPR
jgi:hypothetical protein